MTTPEPLPSQSSPLSPQRACPRREVLRGTVAAVATAATVTAVGAEPAQAAPAPATAQSPVLDGPQLLGGPYLLDPEARRIRVVWCTEDPGPTQAVIAGPGVPELSDAQLLAIAVDGPDRGPSWRRFRANSRPLSQMREDAESQVPGRTYSGIEDRQVWRHLATVRDLAPGRTPYRVVSVTASGHATLTPTHTLAPAREDTAPVRLLLTSDHQLKSMTPANLEVAAQTLGVELDGVLMAGDCVNVPDRASDWFDSASGVAFFAGLTGRATRTIAGRTYRGAPLLQNSPLYPSIGNHEVMGRASAPTLLKRFNDPQPRQVAVSRWEQTRPTDVPREVWLDQHSWNVTSYEELFPFPRDPEAGPRWYHRRIGNVFLVNLFAASIWRPAAATGKGKFQEDTATLGDTDTWGFGQFIFEPIARGSRQYQWLERALSSPSARSAQYRVVMFHQPVHGLGDNSAPPFTDPVQAMALDPATGALTSVAYSYPLPSDHLLRDVEPLLTSGGVNLVLNGHSHVWNRFRSAAGVNWLETSNVGNNYGAFDVSSGRSRNLPPSPDHVLQGDPGGLPPVVPTLAPLTGPEGQPLPFVASSDITVFSALDSGAGVVRSYRFDTRTPAQPPVLFDEFPLA